MNQREAVYSATKSVLKDASIAFEDGSDITEVMTKELRTAIIGIVCAGFSGGTIEFKDTPANKDKLADSSKLTSYTNGLVSNWFRKDQRFNGGVKHTAKNPGSRAHIGDPQLKALRQLRKQFEGTDEEKTAQITAAIDTRQGELDVERAKKVEIDMSVLPEELLSELGLSNDEPDDDVA